ncbi:hypothetical protein BurJ1DRAFT_1484 [Burkholderiales bacterium JOSHI_001]|nr:hypothetical protein BurJ1DRAFT_1484 [Burkholderiales bacterium JOSHI_001]
MIKLPCTLRKTAIGVFACMAAWLTAGSAQAVTPFEQDVSTAIDRGLEYLANSGAYNNPNFFSDSTGLPLLALLEKRATGIPTDPPQGYVGASVTDQGRMRTSATNILDRVNDTSFYAYRDGAWLFALAEYALTGGPDKSVLAPGNVDVDDLKQAMDRLVDRTLANQRTPATGYPDPVNQGYWCYTDHFCEDSSTTQFVVAGLASAKAFYASNKSGDQPYADATRVAAIDAALALARKAYELNATTGSDNASCSALTTTERGHGYNAKFYVPSLAQTASGVYIQLFGGATVNDGSVQSYMEWLKNHYRWQDLDNMGNFWPDLSWSYYMWSSFKGMELVRQSGVTQNPGTIGPNDFGKLAALSAPACPVRQENKDPATLSRVASFGAGGPGYYAAEPKGQYFDYAHQILSLQCADGSFICNGSPGRWDDEAHNSYLLLVLLRSTGGGCVDTDGDGVCDNVDNCPAVSNPGQENTYGDARGDACEPRPIATCDVDGDADIDLNDVNAVRSAIGQTVPAGDKRDANGDRKITIADVRACILKCTRASCAIN